MSLAIPIADERAQARGDGAERANDVLHWMRPGPLQLSALPPLSETRQMFVRPLPSRSLTK